jgi:hypothetical protein
VARLTDVSYEGVDVGARPNRLRVDDAGRAPQIQDGSERRNHFFVREAGREDIGGEGRRHVATPAKPPAQDK